MKKLILLFLALAVSAFAQAAVNYPAISTPFTVNAAVGKSPTITASADGTPPLSYQWYKDGNIWPGQTGATVTFPNAQVFDSGAYKCVITNSSGSTTSPVVTLVIAAPVLAPSNPKASATVN
jgi:hypothetical protein